MKTPAAIILMIVMIISCSQEEEVITCTDEFIMFKVNISGEGFVEYADEIKVFSIETGKVFYVYNNAEIHENAPEYVVMADDYREYLYKRKLITNETETVALDVKIIKDEVEVTKEYYYEFTADQCHVIKSSGKDSLNIPVY